MGAFFVLLEAIPATFWGVVAGSAFTLLGVWLTNRAQDRRQAAQLAHDRELQAKERDLALRKEVYLGATDGIAAAVAYVGRLTDVTAPVDYLQRDYLAGLPGVAKTNIVSSERTALALAQFSATHAEVVFKLLALRGPLANDLQEAERLEIRRQAAVAKVAEITKQLHDNSIGVSPLSAQGVLILREDGRREMARADDLKRQHAAKLADVMQRHLNYVRDCEEAIYRIARLLIPIVAAIRSELGLPYDEAAFQKIAEDARVRTKEGLARLLEEIRSGQAAYLEGSKKAAQTPQLAGSTGTADL